MKSLSVLKFTILLAVIFLFSALETKANSLRPMRVNEVKSCIAQKEKNFGATPVAVGSSDASLKEVNTSVSQLSELIGCVNQGLKINNLSWRIRRDWLIKRFEYYQIRQVFAQYSCYFTNAVQAEKLMVKVNDEIDSRRKKPALQNVSTLQNYALRAKQCSDRAAHFKHIEPEFKQGFQEISAQTDGLLEKIEQLHAVIKKLPN
jgi:hypothetical protein